MGGFASCFSRNLKCGTWVEADSRPNEYQTTAGGIWTGTWVQTRLPRRCFLFPMPQDTCTSTRPDNWPRSLIANTWAMNFRDLVIRWLKFGTWRQRPCSYESPSLPLTKRHGQFGST